MSRPNILILFPDEQSVRFLGCYGNRRAATPAVDRLAAEGATFDAAYTGYPLCVPARLSMLAGKYAHHIGAWDNRSILAPTERTFAHHLSEAGYATCLIGKMHFAGEEQRYGFALRPYGDLCGWSHQPDPIASAFGLSRIDAGPAEIPEEAMQETIVNREAIRFLRAHDRRRPFLLMLGYNRPHFPLRPPARYWERYYPQGYDLPRVPPGHLDDLHPWVQLIRHRSDGDGFDEATTARGRAGYYGCISFVDDTIAAVLDSLETLGYAGNTVVIYASDHGDTAGEHGLWGKRTFYEGSARVPLIVRWPGRVTAGARIAAPASLLDLYPTLCDIAGAPPPPGLDGRSLLPLLEGTECGDDRIAVSDYTQWVPAPMRMVRRGDWKLNYYTGAGFELFNVRDDPDEIHNRAADPDTTGIVQHMAHLLAHGDWHPGPVEAAWRAYQRGGPPGERRQLRTPNQFWNDGPPYRDAETCYPSDVDWNTIKIRP